MSAPTLVSGRPSASAAHRRPSTLLDPQRSRRVSSGSSATTNGTLGATSRTGISTISASSSSASSKLSSTTLRRTGPSASTAATAAARAKKNLLSASSPSPPRKVRNPLGPVPNLPPPPVAPASSTAPATAAAAAAVVVASDHLSPAPSALGSSTGALSGPETDDEAAMLMRASKKRSAPDSFDVRAGGSSATMAAALGAGTTTTAAAAAGTKDLMTRSAALTVRSDFHVGSSTAGAASRTSKSRVSSALETGSRLSSARTSPPTTMNSPMDADELALGAAPLPARRVSPIPPSIQSGSNTRVASPESERPSSRRTYAMDQPNTDSDPLARRRARDSTYAHDLELDPMSGKGMSDSDSNGRALRPALRRHESGSSNGGVAMIPGRSRSNSGKSESPPVRMSLEPIPETDVGGAGRFNAAEARRRRREEEDEVVDDGSTLRYAGNGHGHGNGGGNHDRDRPSSASPTRSRQSPPRTTRFAPLPPSHSGDRLAAEREHRRGRASSDVERDAAAGKGPMRPPPFTRSLASFDDLRGSVPLASHGFASTLNTGLGPHSALQLHSTPAPPSRVGGNSLCALCGHGGGELSSARKPPTPPITVASPQPSPPVSGPFLTQADLADAMARVTDVMESRLADLQLDVLRSARQSRNAIMDGMVRVLGPAGHEEDGDGEDLRGEVERLREENQKLRALLGEGRGLHLL
ncbi:unnamed protein product [Tilletia controversa]|uniref:Uncharacterized protein n=3 Tax=Tilletia TaxID=13289 RepID=A0A8X7MX75_9BASI|nr:hypothetical protein CF336_g1440 [Tilletia laevis]KAE8203558.1 hypothetical protein CF328_g1588 [Tilletia controversa]KAE8263894.1 hypothetical protein A4X03_0g1349 [Tilletia caries]KAE8203111.1 hypothetical protein CF335_g3160 [Tilletia laevis]KAE8252687.1 hypothetical protein A4X06_0g2003 [Tilletia controversa]